MSFPFPFLLLALALLFGFQQSSHAEEVTLPFNGLTLNANLEMADGKTFEDGAILITHGTLAHNKMEIIAAVQQLLNERGFNTLAINLSLGLDNRHGMYDCALTHRHRHGDAVREIAAWVKWLYGKGVKKLVLAGHSRGGNQTAQYLNDKQVPKVLGAALIAPATWDKDAAARSYKSRYKVSVNSLLGKMNRAVIAKKGDTIFENVDFIYCPKSTVSAAAFVGYYGEDKFLDTPTVLVRVKKPVLVIAGSEDTVVKGLPEKMAGVVNSKIKLAVIEGADHFFLDFYAEDVADLIADFAGELLEQP
ncbi:MAG: alpha/beta fold hydrolase [Rhodospirillales bacterium]|nr:alpha/beta fold hydrolase [Rhodospirillales bacterium]